MTDENIDETNDAIEEIRKLKPEERISKLRQMKKDELGKLKKAEDLLKTSKAELEEIERAKKRMPIPELKEVDITKLFGKGDGLEGHVSEERARQAAEQESAQVKYQSNLAQQFTEAPSKDIYQLVEGIYRGFQSTGYITSDQMEVMNAALFATQKKMDSIKSGDYLASKEASQSLVASINIAKFLQDKYKA